MELNSDKRGERLVAPRDITLHSAPIASALRRADKVTNEAADVCFWHKADIQLSTLNQILIYFGMPNLVLGSRKA